MSSFKRHGTAAVAALPAGVRPSSFSSPVPLISTGVSALDDILSGGGLSSGSVLAILPATGTAAQSAAQIGASSSSASSAAETDHVARSAAEPYVELLLAYSIAQGIAAQHRGVVIGEAGSSFVKGLMARAGDLDEQQLATLSSVESAKSADETPTGPSDQLDTVPDDGDDEADVDSALGIAPVSVQREREMKIAWRYERMKQFSTTVSSGSTKTAETEQPFCNTFDLSRHIPARLLQKARQDGNLDIADVDTFAPRDSAYDQAIRHIELAAQRCRQQAQASKSAGNPSTAAQAQPVLRISIRALGSPSWRIARGQRVEVEVIRFLRKLKCLLRDLAMPSDLSSIAVPAVAVVTLSASLLSSLSSGASGLVCNLPHRLTHTVDAAISLSAFAPSPSLRTAFSAYTGALKVLKTPAIGTLTNPSIRASILRGMGAGASAPSQSRGGAGDSSSTVGEGGAGGGENNLAFKVRRKRLVIETLHLDVEGGVSERRTKPPKNMDAETRKPSKPEQVASTAAPGPPSRQSPQQASNSHKPTSSPSATKPKFKGLSSLRQRGLAAANTTSSSAADTKQTSAAPPVDLEVELDTRAAHSHPHPQSHARSQQTRRPHPSTQFTSSRAEDYDF